MRAKWRSVRDVGGREPLRCEWDWEALLLMFCWMREMTWSNSTTSLGRGGRMLPDPVL